MSSTQPSCFRYVDGALTCSICESSVVKNGYTLGGKQRFLCKACQSSKVINPEQRSFGNAYDRKIVQLTKEGLGIRSTARVLEISPATVIRRILEIANRIKPPGLPSAVQRIQVDELHTMLKRKKKETCVIYSWSQELKQVLSLAVGTRSKSNLRLVISPLLAIDVESINTDGYPGYRGVVPKKKHTTYKRRNNGIERQNLNLRTHLKRLNRRTLCYSKSQAMLLAVVKIYFWG